MATDEDASRAGFERADVPSDCDISGLTPSDPEVYTKPQMRDRIKAEVYCSDKGGDPGEWSARKAQLTVQRYEAEGGGYEDSDEFTDSQRDLMVWTEQDWEYGGDEEARYLPKAFWEELSEEEKEKVNDTKEEGSDEGKQFVSLPEEIQERFAEWREENREKYLEDARENPPQEDLRQRSLARDAYAVLQDYIETWEPHYQPKKLELTRAVRDGDFWNVLRADARLLGFSDPLTPLHFLFFENNRVAGGAALYRTKNLGIRDLPDDEPGIFLRFFDEGWTEEGKVVEEEEINDSTFLRQNGSVVSKVEGFGTPKLYYSFETVHSALEVATPPTDPQAPSVGLGDFVELEPWDLDPDEFVDRLVQHVRLASPTQNKMQASTPDDAERALREAVANLRALKRQLAHVLQEKKTTFIHEFQHHFDRSRMPEGAVVGSSTLTGRAGLPTDEYFNTDMEVNARYQEGLAEFEDVMLSDPEFMRSKIEGGFDERDLIRLLKQFTPAYEKLNEENQRRLITRWTKYYNQIVEPRIEKLAESTGEEDEEEGGGLPEDLQALLDAAETLAGAQQTLEEALEDAGGPLGRSMSEDRRISTLDEKIREGFSALREKADERGYDFDTILERTPLEPVRENPVPTKAPRENKPEDRFHVRRGEEHTDPDDYVTGFPGEPHNTFTREGVEGAKFRMWFGDWTDEDADHSVVMGEDGRPLQVYHGTKNGGFNRFLVGEELRDSGSPGVFFTDSRRHAESYSGSGEDIGPAIIAPGDLTDRSMGFEVEERRLEKRAYNVLDGEEVIDTVLERDPAMERVLFDYSEEGYEIEKTRVDRYLVEHRGRIILENGTEDEKIAALEKILQEANDRAEIPPRQKEGVMTAYLNIRDPLVLDFEGQTWEDPPEPVDFFSIDEASRFARNAGYDGLIAKNIRDPGPETRYSGTATEYIVFDGDQVAVQGHRSDQIAIPRSETDPRLNPPSEATVDVPDGPSYTVEPGDVILREGAEHEELSREKIAAPPEEARALAQKARKWKEKGAPGMHETGMRRMLQIGAGYRLSPAELEVVKNWFARKKSEKEKGYHKMEDWAGHDEQRPSESLLSWWGWGGDPMMEWTKDMLDQMPDRTRLTDEALAERENPLIDAQVDTEREVPIVTDSFFVDVTTEVVYPSPGTDRGFRLETSTLGETYAYGFARTDEFDGEEYEGLAELSWIQVDENLQGERVGARLLGDVLRFLAATGADHVAVRPLSDAARGLNDRAEEIGLWHQTMQAESGMEMYAIDVGPKSRLGVPLAGRDFEFDADRDDVEDAVRFLYDPSDVVWDAAAQPTDARPWTYMQPLRPAASSGDLDSEYNRDVEIYETFEDAPGVSKGNGFFFRTDAPITVDDLTRTSAQPVGIDTRTWTLMNAINSYQGQTSLPEFAIINRSKKWLMEFEQGEGETEGKTLLTFSRAGNRAIETHEHPSLQDALEETLRFRDRGDQVEYLPMEFLDTALDQWEEEERENPAEGLTEEGVARAVEALAYDIRENFWDQGFYPFRLQEATGEILHVGEKIREGEIEVDPLAFDPIPYSELPSGPVSDIQSMMEDIGDLRTVEEYAEEEIMPFIEEDMETRPFDPFADKDLLPLVKRQLRTAPDWQSTGYVMPDGTPLSLGGRGARRRDHRDVYVPDRLIPDWLDPDRNFSSMLALIEAGVIRVKPSGLLGLDMHNEPTSEQKEWIRKSILSSNPPSEVVVDVSKPGEGATESDSARLSPLPRKVIRFIEDFYSGRGGSKVARFRRENPDGTLSEQMARLYPTWKPRDAGSKIEAQHVKWIMPGGQAIGAKPQGGDEIHHNHFELPDGFEADEMPRRELVDRGAVSVWVTSMSGLDHVSVNVVSGVPLTDAQKTTLRDLVGEIGADKVVGALSDARGEDLGSVPSEQIEADSAESFIKRAEDFYASDAGRQNPDGTDPAYIVAVGDTQSANLQNFKPDSQRLVVMSPGKYLKHVREHFEDTPGGDYETARESITRESPHVSDERIQEMKERMTGRKPLDALWFDVRLGQQGTDSPIIGQEGRHRAIAAKELGIRHVPVILWAHRQKKGKGMFGGMADVKVPVEGEEFPERIMAGTTEIEWPESPTATETLWRRAKFGREFA